MSECLACSDRAATIGVLCDQCAGEIVCDPSHCPEQIERCGANHADPPACLVDIWGRKHRLAAATLIGRDPGGEGLALRHGSVSRVHAEIVLDRKRWVLRDRGGRNGTFVNGERISDRVELGHGDLVQFAKVAFYFADSYGDRATASNVSAFPTVTDISAFDANANGAPTPAEPATHVPGLAQVPVVLWAHPRSVGGLFEAHGKSLQLTELQFALVRLLAEHMVADEPSPLCGFVPTVRLLTELPWGTANPTAGQLKALIRRTRKRLAEIGIADAIEGRRELGYRLAIARSFVTLRD